MKKLFLIIILICYSVNGQNTDVIITELVNEKLIVFLEKIPIGRK